MSAKKKKKASSQPRRGWREEPVKRVVFEMQADDKVALRLEADRSALRRIFGNLGSVTNSLGEGIMTIMQLANQTGTPTATPIDAEFGVDTDAPRRIGFYDMETHAIDKAAAHQLQRGAGYSFCASCGESLELS